jgi:hypothetical protein
MVPDYAATFYSLSGSPGRSSHPMIPCHLEDNLTSSGFDTIFVPQRKLGYIHIVRTIYSIEKLYIDRRSTMEQSLIG